MAAARLPGKPLADICGKPMIMHVYERAKLSSIGRVVVACAEKEIYDVVINGGGEAVMTQADLPSGTDRVKQAADIIDKNENHDIIVNVQGDMPTMQADIIGKCVNVLHVRPEADIATLVVASDDEEQKKDPNVVKAVMSFSDDNAVIGRALYFTRAGAPYGNGNIWHHVGIYAYRRGALSRFCKLPPSGLETRERLEQLRALEAGMQIHAAIIDSEPHGVDTRQGLQLARRIIAGE